MPHSVSLVAARKKDGQKYGSFTAVEYKNVLKAKFRSIFLIILIIFLFLKFILFNYYYFIFCLIIVILFNYYYLFVY